MKTTLYRYALVIMLLCAAVSQGHAQAYLSPYQFTNRPMGFVSDATAVGWNPSLIGLEPEEVDLLFGFPVDDAFKRTGPSAFFGKFGTFAGGFIPKTDNSPAQLYGGLGFDVFNDVWFGASALYSEPLTGDANKAKWRWNAAVAFSPVRWGLFSVGASTMYYGPVEGPVAYAQAAMSPTPWLTGHIDFRLDPDSKLFTASGLGATQTLLGLSASAFKGTLVASASYIIEQEMPRLGVEINLGGLAVGTIAKANEPNQWHSTPFVRLHSSQHYSIASMFNPTVRARRNVTDAACLTGQYLWPAGTEVSRPEELYDVVARAGGSYRDLLAKMDYIAPLRSDLIQKITKEYYPYIEPPKPVRSLTSPLRVPKSAELIVEGVDSTSVAPDRIVQFRARDAFGRNLGNLREADIQLNDRSLLVKKISQTNAENTQPVDIVIAMDCSGSMGGEIAAVRENVRSFAQNIRQRGIDARIGCILYGEEVYDVLDPTADMEEFLRFFAQASATGPDEITSEAIRQAANVSFRPGAQRVVIAITDDCSFQGNSGLTEAALTQELWERGVRFFPVLNRENNNAGILTRLTLGRDYDVKQPFTSVLDNLMADLSTTYEVRYGPKPTPKPTTLTIKGTVKSETGKPLPAVVALNYGSTNVSARVNGLTGDYEFTVDKLAPYALSATSVGYRSAQKTLDGERAKFGDTLYANLVLGELKTLLSGRVVDEQGLPMSRAAVSLEDIRTNRVVDNGIAGDAGEFSFVVRPGANYRINAKAPDYIPGSAAVDIPLSAEGTETKQNVVLSSIEKAIESGRAFKLENILFATGSAVLQSESFIELDRLVAFLEEYATVRVEVSAHTDAVGKDEDNQRLSDSRSASVVKYLSDRGIASSRLIAKGYGETRPVGDNNTPEGRALNRRVEFKLIR